MRNGIAAFSLPQDYLNVRGHVSVNAVPGGLTAVVIVIVTAQIHYEDVIEMAATGGGLPSTSINILLSR